MPGEGGRKLLLVGGAAAFVAGWQRFMVRPVALDSRRIDGAPGWQFASAGGLSGLSGAALLTLGLEPGPEPLPAARLEAVVQRDHVGGAPTWTAPGVAARLCLFATPGLVVGRRVVLGALDRDGLSRLLEDATA